ncbi:hypothetical protein J3R73_002039 [Labrys monachus]|uniref:Uncharacterized protein n=1 Tax=Labrys monachus TaxID=217067 RepID=A0ABU0FCA5_9HYPH|nr:hypothetical protein [Labrys monachus]
MSLPRSFRRGDLAAIALACAVAFGPAAWDLAADWLNGHGVFAQRVGVEPRPDLLMAYCADHGVAEWGRCVGLYEAGRVTEADLADSRR